MTGARVRLAEGEMVRDLAGRALLWELELAQRLEDPEDRDVDADDGRERAEHLVHARQVARNEIAELDRRYHLCSLERSEGYQSLRAGVLAWNGLWRDWRPAQWLNGKGPLPRLVWGRLEAVARWAVRP